MARKSLSWRDALPERASTPPPRQSTRKRAQSSVEKAAPDAKPPKQQKTRAAAKRAIRSKYFERSTSTQPPEEESSDELSSAPGSGSDGEASNFDAGTDQESASEVSDLEDDGFSDDQTAGRRRKSVPKKGAPAASLKSLKGKELWRPGVKTGLGPGTRIVIKKPKARPAGDTPYADDTIHPNTLLFLGDLKANNDREWLKMHDPDFRASEKDFKSFIEVLSEKLTEIDDTIPELPIKDIVFRIYRDIRFSPDPTPYKPYFSAAWSRTGRKGPYAAYYLQISPGDSFIGGGLWHPEARPIGALRRDIDRHPERIKGVLMDDGLRKEYLGSVEKAPAKVVKAFVMSPTNSESALKTKPKGYDASHKDIELLRLKSFTLGRKLSDNEVIGPEAIGRIAQLLSCIYPFITYLNSVVMPDEPAEESGETDSAEQEDE